MNGRWNAVEGEALNTYTERAQQRVQRVGGMAQLPAGPRRVHRDDGDHHVVGGVHVRFNPIQPSHWLVRRWLHCDGRRTHLVDLDLYVSPGIFSHK